MKFLLTWLICLVTLVLGIFGIILVATINPIAFLIILTLFTSVVLAYAISGGIE